MNLDIIISCPVKVFKRCLHGHLDPIGHHSRLTVNYVNDDHSQQFVVYDERRRELLRMVPETDITRYTILSPYRHEISRYNDTTVVLDFYEEDSDDVRTFTIIMEDVSRRLNRFSSHAEVRDSSSSGSDDDVERNGAGAAALCPTAVVRYWECSHCHYASLDRHSCTCEECSAPRVVNIDLEWRCNCPKVYPIGFAECKLCGMWRCHKCTFNNEPTSPHECVICFSKRIR